MTERVLVTGGAGFIGSHVCEQLLRQGRSVRVLDDLSTGSRENLAAAGVSDRDFVLGSIVDADTGYGPPSVVREAVQEFERAGLAGMQIEDQEEAKKCGHLSGKRLIPTADMVAKITAAVEAKCDRDFVLVARTDARTVDGLQAAIQRKPVACSRARAGAFVDTTIVTFEQITRGIKSHIS